MTGSNRGLVSSTLLGSIALLGLGSVWYFWLRYSKANSALQVQDTRSTSPSKAGSHKSETTTAKSTDNQTIAKQATPLSPVPKRVHPEQTEADMLYNQGLAYLDREEHTLATKCFQQAASQDHAGALLCLGVALFTGQGVPRDPVAAVSLVRRSAAAGCADACYTLGGIYEAGLLGVQRDFAQAVEWFQRAVEEDASIDYAMYSLGVCYAQGLGVPRDQAESARWFQRAAKLGNEAAARALQETDGHLAD